VGKPVAKKDDQVVGIDTHIVMVNTPGGAIPTPMPSPFSGKLTDNLSSTVFVDGQPVAVVGSAAENRPSHVAIGGFFQNTPANKGKISSTSGTTFADDKGIARQGDPVECCNDPVDSDTGHVIASSGTVYSG
jgi:uncharacterized Zn-binding protein involved in type VI secretion